MALKWFLNSAFTQVLGQPNNSATKTTTTTSEGQGQAQAQAHDQESFKQLGSKDSNKEVVSGAAKIDQAKNKKSCYGGGGGFEMPLHYPRYKKADYEKMEEWKVDMLLKQYGLSFEGNLDQKRAYAMGAFLWPDQL